MTQAHKPSITVQKIPSPPAVFLSKCILGASIQDVRTEGEGVEEMPDYADEQY